jgi:hypothetical protein
MRSLPPLEFAEDFSGFTPMDVRATLAKIVLVTAHDWRIDR